MRCIPVSVRGRIFTIWTSVFVRFLGTLPIRIKTSVFFILFYSNFFIFIFSGHPHCISTSSFFPRVRSLQKIIVGVGRTYYVILFTMLKNSWYTVRNTIRVIHVIEHKGYYWYMPSIMIRIKRPFRISSHWTDSKEDWHDSDVHSLFTVNNNNGIKSSLSTDFGPFEDLIGKYRILQDRGFLRNFKRRPPKGSWTQGFRGTKR